MIPLQRYFLVQEDESNYVQFIFSSRLLSIWTRKYVKDEQREIRTIIVGKNYYTNEVLVLTIYRLVSNLQVGGVKGQTSAFGDSFDGHEQTGY